MPKKFPSKESKSKLRKHLELLLLILILSVLFLFLIIFLNYKDFIYPELHRNQSSPKDYIEKTAKNLPVKPEVIEHGPRDKKRVALTFDADMTPAMALLLKKSVVKSWYNKPIKDTLDRESVKATVFLGGLWSTIYPKEAWDLAHDPLLEIGNHSYNHYAFAKNCYKLGEIKNEADKDDVEAAQKAIFEATGKIAKYFRFPGGCYEDIDVKTIAKLGLKIIHWDVVAGDGFNKDVSSIVKKVESNVQNGSIIVFHIHDGPYAPKTNDALVKIIPGLKKRGFEFVKVSELIGLPSEQ